MLVAHRQVCWEQCQNHWQWIWALSCWQAELLVLEHTGFDEVLEARRGDAAGGNV